MLRRMFLASFTAPFVQQQQPSVPETLIKILNEFREVHPEGIEIRIRKGQFCIFRFAYRMVPGEAEFYTIDIPFPGTGTKPGDWITREGQFEVNQRLGWKVF